MSLRDLLKQRHNEVAEAAVQAHNEALHIVLMRLSRVTEEMADLEDGIGEFMEDGTPIPAMVANDLYAESASIASVSTDDGAVVVEIDVDSGRQIQLRLSSRHARTLAKFLHLSCAALEANNTRPAA